ncbi:hypothetical protein QBC34DRAFT_455444 [Podospora aff. communis PSN243]|uniref:Uncharacterized protein n=1 Tax=Podospora aff. communis PSN243 TaxID=3040156 RepID=A0AAV9H162_9PEZI|nr:hypothetical protein QBC34DRAFT_455444 [Podospora aff. communis PSN243]
MSEEARDDPSRSVSSQSGTTETTKSQSTPAPKQSTGTQRVGLMQFADTEHRVSRKVTDPTPPFFPEGLYFVERTDGKNPTEKPIRKSSRDTGWVSASKGEKPARFLPSHSSTSSHGGSSKGSSASHSSSRTSSSRASSSGTATPIPSQANFGEPFPAPGFPPSGFPPSGPPPFGFPPPGSPPGFPHPGFPHPGFPHPGFPHPGFPHPGFPHPGFPPPGNPPPHTGYSLSPAGPFPSRDQVSLKRTHKPQFGSSGPIATAKHTKPVYAPHREQLMQMAAPAAGGPPGPFSQTGDGYDEYGAEDYGEESADYGPQQSGSGWDAGSATSRGGSSGRR